MEGLTLVHWLLIGNFAMLLGVAAFIAALRKQQSDDARIFEQKIEHLEQGQVAISQSAIGLGRRIKQVETRSAKMQQTPVPVDEESHRFEQASRLAGMGASVEDLIDSLGVARSEAELMVSMKRSANA